MNSVNVAVLGAGLAGLSAAYHLRGHARVRVFEAASAVGGRARSVRTGSQTWANLGAQYISADKALVFELAAALNVDLVPTDGLWGDTLDRLEALKACDPQGVEEIHARIHAEQSYPRDPSASEIDDTTFDSWLGEVSGPVSEYLKQWCRVVVNTDLHNPSLYGILLAWGDQRVSPWILGRDMAEGRRSSLVRGGTGRLAECLAAASGAEVVTENEVLRVTPKTGGYRIDVRGPAGEYACDAEVVVCALPAPAVLRIVSALPSRKIAALAAIRYGRYITTPVLVAPSSGAAESADADRVVLGLGTRSTFSGISSSGFTFPTPTDFNAVGGTVHSFIAEPDLGDLWGCDDAEVATRVAVAFKTAFPELRHRLHDVLVQRWEHGLPWFTPGRVKLQPVLEGPSAGIYFAGDYTGTANMNGALESGRRAANQLLEELSLGHLHTTDQRRVKA